MGTALLDAYSLLHFAVGVIGRHWNIEFLVFIVAHAIFELVENTKAGMHFINTYVTAWPGGKPSPDSFINSQIGDNLCATLGWWAADALLKTL